MADGRWHPLVDGCPPAWATEWGQDEWGVFVGFRVEGVRQRMRWIPPGSFMMGSPEGEVGRDNDEGPQHEVTLTRGFWLGDTPVTQTMWTAVMGSNPSRIKGGQQPVERVNWDDCQALCEKLEGVLGGRAPRLPTEAEWEYACRAGTKTATYAGDLDGMQRATALEDIAWYRANSANNDAFLIDQAARRERQAEQGRRDEELDIALEGTGPAEDRRQTHPVKSKQPNPWGLYDTLGNVREWCLDGQRRYSNEAIADPVGPTHTGGYRVTRGGSWHSIARYVRAAYRHADAPGNRFDSLGLRLARDQDQAG